ncbi:MAG: hypothetical protein CFH41_01032 [Alphaproteobacteria bacterium MarineAlpha11_Bin1]|nr:MAG: hypothetical protein CFH41_01032 [Alphaproteobacteria bacterium MarineAlpha11_Bin1]
MLKVRIYKPRKNAMQSGRAKSRDWVVEFEPGAKPRNDSLMGWVGQGDTRNQIKMRFSSQEDAIAFCERKGLHYQVSQPRPRKIKLKSYSDNFAHSRKKNWTH